jgi:hypothetical protein
VILPIVLFVLVGLVATGAMVRRRRRRSFLRGAIMRRRFLR